MLFSVEIIISATYGFLQKLVDRWTSQVLCLSRLCFCRKKFLGALFLCFELRTLKFEMPHGMLYCELMFVSISLFHWYFIDIWHSCRVVLCKLYECLSYTIINLVGIATILLLMFTVHIPPSNAYLLVAGSCFDCG